GAEADEPRTDPVGDRLHLAEMLVHLVTGLVDRLQRRAGKLQLPTRFQAHVGAVLREPDDVALLQHRLPAVALRQPVKHGLDRPRAVVGQGFQAVLAVAEFLVLGPDAPVRLRLAARREIGREVLEPFDRAAALLWNGHGSPRSVYRFRSDRPETRPGPSQAHPAARGHDFS